MNRYLMELAYDGSAYFGWQIQPKQKSVQETIQKALSKIYSNVPITIVGCGRTDTGVHASHYIAHVDLKDVEDTAQLVYKLNKMLPKDIAIKAIKKVANDFHARFDATSRTYRYYIHQEKNPFNNKFSTFYRNELNFEAMNEAASTLIGTHDFTSLSKINEDLKSSICTITEAKWIQLNDKEYYFTITANRFLRNMVRATVGTLFDVGTGKITPSDFQSIIDQKSREAASSSAPAEGLTLWEICY